MAKKTTRRDFLKLSATAVVGAAGAGSLLGADVNEAAAQVQIEVPPYPDRSAV